MLRAVGLTTEQAEKALWTVEPDGTKQNGAAAVNVVLDSLSGLRLFQRLYNLPLIGSAEDIVYSIIAENRSSLPGTKPAVERPEPWKPQR